MANPDPQNQDVFSAVAYTTVGDNSSSIINVPAWATQMTLFISATHAGTLDTIVRKPGNDTSYEFDSARATVAGANQFTFDFYAPRVQFVWASGTASAGTVNAFVSFTRGSKS